MHLDETLARVGLLIPSSNTVMDQDLARGLRDIATVHTARMHLTETTEQAETAMLDRYLPQAIADVASLRPRVTVFGCTSAGAIRGADYDQDLCSRIAQQTGGLALSTLASVTRAISATGRTRIAVLTPYVDQLNARIRASLEASSLEVLDIVGFGIADNVELAAPTPREIFDRAVSLARRTAPELLFLCCANFRALPVRSAVEAAAGVPVVTSNSAVIDAVRRHLHPPQTSTGELPAGVRR